MNVGIVIQVIDRATAPFRAVTENFAKLRTSVDKAKESFKVAADMERAAAGVAKFASQARGMVEGPIRLAVEFESAMSIVASKTSASNEELQRLTATARDLGKSTVFSSMGVASAMQSLGTAGFSSSKIIGAMPGLLDLAAASGTGLSEVATLTATTLNSFGLAAEESTRVADVLSASANSSATDLSELGAGLSYVSATAASVGQSLEQTVAMLGALADGGLKGTRGGTALQAMLARLQAPGGDAIKILRRLGIRASDTAGNLRPMVDILGDLNVATAEMGTARRGRILKELFSLEAMGAGTILMGKLELVAEKTARGLNSAGEAARFAARNMDNAQGDLTELDGAIEDLGITIGNVALPAIRQFATIVGNLVGPLNTWAAAHPTITKAVVMSTVAVAALGAGLASLLIVLAAATTAAGVLGVAFGLQGTGAQILGHALSVARVQTLALATANGTATFSVGRLMLSIVRLAATLVSRAIYSLALFTVTMVFSAIPAIWAAATAFAGLGVAIMATPIGWIAGGIALIAGGAFLIYRNWGKVSTFWEGIGPKWRAAIELTFLPIFAFIRLGQYVVANWSAYGDFFSQLWDLIVGAFTWAGGAVMKALRWVWVGNAAFQVLRLGARLLMTAWRGVGSFFVILWGGIKSTFASVFDWIVQRIDTVAGWAVKIVELMPGGSRMDFGAPRPSGPNRATVENGKTEVGGTLEVKVVASPGFQVVPGNVQSVGPMQMDIDTGWSMAGVG